MNRTLILYDPQRSHKALLQLWADLKPWLMAGHHLTLSVRPEKRSDAQNRRLWSLLADVSTQVVWHGQKLTSEEWKDVLTASLKKQRAVPGVDGGFVILGQRTSQMTKAEMSELQELIEAFGAQHGVKFIAHEYEMEPA